MLRVCVPLLLPLIVFTRLAEAEEGSFAGAQQFLQTWCVACHAGKSAQGGFDVHSVATPATLKTDGQKWTKLARRIRSGDMPPKSVSAPPLALREQFVEWVDG
jgi:uncharacterized membrane protein